VVYEFAKLRRKWKDTEDVNYLAEMRLLKEKYPSIITVEI